MTEQPRLEVLHLTDILRWSNYARLFRNPLECPSLRPLYPEASERDRWAIYLYDDAGYAGKRYPIGSGFGNLLLTHVKFLPFSALRSELSRVELYWYGCLAEFRSSEPGFPGSRTVARFLPLSAVKQTGTSGLSRKPEQSNQQTLGLEKAKQISELVDRHHLVIFVDDSGLVGWKSLLPFLVETSAFYVVEPAHADSNQRSPGVPLRHHHVQNVTLTEHRLFGWTVWVIEN